MLEVTTTTVSPVEITTLDEQLPATTPSKSVSPDFNFNAEHNGEACIESLKPEDKGTERQFRFTRALLCTLLGVKSVNTIDNHVEALMKRGVVTDVKNLTSVMLPDSLGRECVKTTLYDLTVFNYLVMRLDTDQAWEMKAKFNDVLVEIPTLDEQLPATTPSKQVSPEFDLNAVHNGEACIASLDPRDTRENKFWFTIAMFVAIYNESDQTIRNNIESLYQDGELGDSKIFERRINIKDACGVPHPTAIYNLTVLNRLGMCCFRKNKRAKGVRDKFNDVLLDSETGITQPELSDAEIMSRALEIAHKTLALREERIKALQAERDEAIRTKTQYQSNLAAQMSGRVGGLTSALNRVKLENDRLKGDRLTKEDVYIIMQTQGVSFTLKTVKDVIRDALNTISEYLDEPFPKIKTGEHTDGNGKVFDVQSYVYTRKTVRAFFEYVENNPLGWQARNRKFILSEWLNHGMTIPV